MSEDPDEQDRDEDEPSQPQEQAQEPAGGEEEPVLDRLWLEAERERRRAAKSAWGECPGVRP